MFKTIGGAKSYQPFVLLELVKKSSLIFIASDLKSLRVLEKQILFLQPDLMCSVFPSMDEVTSAAISAQRLRVLYQILNCSEPYIILTTSAAIRQNVPSITFLEAQQKVLDNGSHVVRSDLIELLLKWGYRRCELVLEPGDMAVRGSLIDIFPGGTSYPVRIDFWGDEIEQIRKFNIVTQKTLCLLDKGVILLPIQEGDAPQGSFEDYLPSSIQIVLTDDVSLEFPHRTVSSLSSWSDQAHSLIHNFSSIRKIEPSNLLPSVERLFQEHQNNGQCAVFLAHSSRSVSLIQKRWQEQCLKKLIITEGWPLTEVRDTSHIYLTHAPFDEGFISHHWCVLTELEVFGKPLRIQPERKHSLGFLLNELRHLHEGDYVVHRDHGIGLYQGLEVVDISGANHDCVRLSYEGGDRLFLPVENLDVISRYEGGGEGKVIRLDQLGSPSWQTRKDAVRERLYKVAEYLSRIAAERFLKQAPVFDSAHAAYESFSADFPFEETDDQLMAIDDVLKDLASGKPMDRLICGDVGFGKTEVAMRAAFVVALHGQQVVVVVPTTLLCRQHFQRFVERFQNKYHFKVAQLSRLVTSKDASHTKQELKEGDVSILVTTQGIFNDTIEFANLGLLIVDEEHRFGVKQKEYLKNLKKDVHVLTLTATPIPRTLQLSLAGIRELSLITQPPTNRIPVRLFVVSSEDPSLHQAILREYARGGQVIYVTPRIEYLHGLEESLRVAFPQLKIAIAHGRMSPSELEKMIEGFYEHQFDVLLSTNIIESGIDIVTANTIIIDRADLFGLSQLYQLKGRVGRSQIQGYAYFSISVEHSLTEQAKKRLQAIQSLEALGSGFSLASYDLDIRGAGNILGEEQSGHIREIGVELYQKFLQEAVASLQKTNGDSSEKEIFSPSVKMGLPIVIPTDYIPDLGARMSLYRRAAALKTLPEVKMLALELEDRFGLIPQDVTNLLVVIKVKVLCRAAFIEKLEMGVKGTLLTFRQRDACPVDILAFIQDFHLNNASLMLKLRPDNKIILFHKDTKIQPKIKAIVAFLESLISFESKAYP